MSARENLLPRLAAVEWAEGRANRSGGQDGWKERGRERGKVTVGRGRVFAGRGEWMEEAVNERLRKRNNGGVERFDN